MESMFAGNYYILRLCNQIVETTFDGAGASESLPVLPRWGQALEETLNSEGAVRGKFTEAGNTVQCQRRQLRASAGPSPSSFSP